MVLQCSKFNIFLLLLYNKVELFLYKNDIKKKRKTNTQKIHINGHSEFCN